MTGPAAPHAVRIIGGTLRRSRLPVADSPGLRPTPDRVRETLFNWLGQDLTGWHCLDAFAGSGALGFEAASRGAAVVVMLERVPALARGLEATRARLGVQSVRIECVDALRWMASSPPGRFDLVMLDPPYAAGLMPRALALALALLVPQGWLYVEQSDSIGDVPAGLELHRHDRAGAVHFGLLRRSR